MSRSSGVVKTWRLPTEDESKLAAESNRLLADCLDSSKQTRLVAGDTDVPVPAAALQMLVEILNQMARGNTISLVPVPAEFTTQQAADLLNVSRPYLVKQLEAGKIPFYKRGRHRRIRCADLMAYKEQVDKTSREAADTLTAEAQEIGLGY